MKGIRRIMVLAGGPDQAALIGEIKKLYPDSFVVLVDMNPNVVASKVADKHIIVSTMDFDKVEQAAIEEDIDIILTACGDQPMLTMGIVSERLGLPCFLNKQQIMNLTNKMLMKRLMVENGIPTSKFKVFSNIENLDVSGLNYPLIVKPVDSNGSKGVRKVENDDELHMQAGVAIEFSPSRTVIVEEFVEGEDVSSDFYVHDGKVTAVMDCLSNKYKPNEGVAVIYQSLIPAPVSDSVRTQLQSIAEKIAEVFEIKNSPLIVQTIVRGDNVSVIEFSARLGGGAKYKTIETVTNFNVLRANLLSMLGKTSEITPVKSNRYYSRCHFYTTGGVFNRFEGHMDLQNKGVVEDFIINRTSGTVLSEPRSSGDRVGSSLISDNSVDGLRKRVMQVISGIRILDNDGNDIFLRDMYADPIKNANGI